MPQNQENVPAQGVMRTDYVPSICVWNNPENHPRNLQEYTNLVRFMYNSLQVYEVRPAVREGDNDIPAQVRIICDWARLSNEEFNTRINQCQIQEKGFTPQKSFYGFWQAANRTCNSVQPLTRTQIVQISATFDDAQKNAALLEHKNALMLLDAAGNQVGQNDDDNIQLYILQHVLKDLANICINIIRKAQMGVNLYKLIYKFQSGIPDLNAAVGAMLLDLAPRHNVNKTATELAKIRDEAMTIFKEYLQLEPSYDIVKTTNDHFPGTDIQTEVFNYQTFCENIRTERIFARIHIKAVQGQLTHLLEETEIKKSSAELDKLIEKIQTYRPSEDSQHQRKITNIRRKAKEIITQYQSFVEIDEASKTKSKAKLILDTLNLVYRECESLDIIGINFDKQTIGVDPNDIKLPIEFLSIWLENENQKQKQREQQLQINAKTYTQNMPGLILPKLHDTTDYLNFVTNYTAIKSSIQDKLTLANLLKSCLVKRRDIEYLNSEYDPEKILSYIREHYADHNLIVQKSLENLYAMKNCGSNVDIMIANGDKFRNLLRLFKIHHLLPKIDRIARDRLFPKIFLDWQQLLFVHEQVKAEQRWKIADQNPEEEVVDDRLRVGDEFLTPSSSLTAQNLENLTEQQRIEQRRIERMTENRNICIQETNNLDNYEIDQDTLIGNISKEEDTVLLETRRRKFFIKLHNRFYDAAQKIKTASKVQINKFDDKFQQRRQTQGVFSTHTHESPQRMRNTGKCPIFPCIQQGNHRKSLLNCQTFRKMDSADRWNIVSKLKGKVCRRCLTYGMENHEVINGKCPTQHKHPKLYCKNRYCIAAGLQFNHSPMICKQRQDSNPIKSFEKLNIGSPKRDVKFQKSPSTPTNTQRRYGQYKNRGTPQRYGQNSFRGFKTRGNRMGQYRRQGQNYSNSDRLKPGVGQKSSPASYSPRGRGQYRGRFQYKRPNRNQRISSSQKAYGIHTTSAVADKHEYESAADEKCNMACCSQQQTVNMLSTAHSENLITEQQCYMIRGQKMFPVPGLNENNEEKDDNKLKSSKRNNWKQFQEMEEKVKINKRNLDIITWKKQQRRIDKINRKQEVKQDRKRNEKDNELCSDIPYSLENHLSKFKSIYDGYFKEEINDIPAEEKIQIKDVSKPETFNEIIQKELKTINEVKKKETPENNWGTRSDMIVQENRNKFILPKKLERKNEVEIKDKWDWKRNKPDCIGNIVKCTQLYCNNNIPWNAWRCKECIEREEVKQRDLYKDIENYMETNNPWGPPEQPNKYEMKFPESNIESKVKYKRNHQIKSNNEKAQSQQQHTCQTKFVDEDIPNLIESEKEKMLLESDPAILAWEVMKEHQKPDENHQFLWLAKERQFFDEINENWKEINEKITGLTFLDTTCHIMTFNDQKLEDTTRKMVKLSSLATIDRDGTPNFIGTKVEVPTEGDKNPLVLYTKPDENQQQKVNYKFYKKEVNMFQAEFPFENELHSYQVTGGIKDINILDYSACFNMASSCSIQGKDGNFYEGTAMYDGGATLNLVDEDFAKRMRLQKIDGAGYEGFVRTLHANQWMSLNYYIVPIWSYDDQKIIYIIASGMQGLREGRPNCYPEEFYKTICKAAGIPLKKIDIPTRNSYYDVLIGLPSYSHHPEEVEVPQRKYLKEKHPNIKILNPKFAKGYIIAGALKKRDEDLIESMINLNINNEKRKKCPRRSPRCGINIVEKSNQQCYIVDISRESFKEEDEIPQIYVKCKVCGYSFTKLKQHLIGSECIKFYNMKEFTDETLDNLILCKGCGESFKSLMSHLKNTKSKCKESYDMKKLQKEMELQKIQRRKKYQKIFSIKRAEKRKQLREEKIREKMREKMREKQSTEERMREKMRMEKLKKELEFRKMIETILGPSKRYNYKILKFVQDNNQQCYMVNALRKSFREQEKKEKNYKKFDINEAVYDVPKNLKNIEQIDNELNQFKIDISDKSESLDRQPSLNFTTHPKLFNEVSVLKFNSKNDRPETVDIKPSLNLITHEKICNEKPENSNRNSVESECYFESGEYEAPEFKPKLFHSLKKIAPVPERKNSCSYSYLFQGTLWKATTVRHNNNYCEMKSICDPNTCEIHKKIKDFHNKIWPNEACVDKFYDEDEEQRNMYKNERVKNPIQFTQKKKL